MPRVSLPLRGLPRPELRYPVRDELGHDVARLDMAYPLARVGVEFDGEHHQATSAFRADLALHNCLAALGWTVLQASTADVLRNPTPSPPKSAPCSTSAPPDPPLPTSPERGVRPSARV